MQYLLIFFIKEPGCKPKLAQIDLKNNKFLSQQVHIILKATHRSKRHSTTTLQQTILLFMDDYNSVITNSCLQSHYIWKSFKKNYRSTPIYRGTEDRRICKAAQPLPSPIILNTHITPRYPQRSPHRPYSLPTASKY